MGCTQWMKKLMRKKVSTDEDLDRSELRRCLSIVELIILGIGNTLGAGVYILSGQVARESAGPAVVLSFLIAGLTASLAGLCYAEFAARVPRAGSAYVYSYVTVGELMAYVIGWNILLEYIICVGATARALSAYVDDLTGNSMQEFFHRFMPMAVPGLSTYPDFFAFGLVALVTAIAAVGVKESTRVSNVLASITMFVIVSVVICGSFKADFRNWQLSGDELPAQGAGHGGFAPFGFSGIMAGSATCFYAFLGFDFIASMSEEAEDSRRSIPISMGVTLLVNLVVYCSVSVVMTLMVPYYLLDMKAPIPFAFDQVGWGPARYFIAVGAVSGMCSCMLGAMFPMARVVYAMASDGLIFRGLSTVSPRFRTPFLGTVLCGGIAGVMTLLFDVHELIEMLSIGTLLAFALVAVSVLILRYETDANSAEAQYVTQNGIPDPTASTFQLIHLIRPSSGTPTESSARTAKILIAFMCGCMLAWTLVMAVGSGQMSSLSATTADTVIAVLFGTLTLLTVFLISRQPQSSLNIRFKVPLVPVLPAISCQVNVYLMMKLSTVTWIRFVIWLVIGFCIYFVYGIRHSSLNIPTDECEALIASDGKTYTTVFNKRQPVPSAPCLDEASDIANCNHNGHNTDTDAQMQDSSGESLR